MSITIKNKNGVTIYHTVAKTSKGFNARQRFEIAAVRDLVRQNPEVKDISSIVQSWRMPRR